MKFFSPIVWQLMVKTLLWTLTGLTIGILFFIIFVVFVNGLPQLSWEFLSTNPADMGRSGGILATIVSTLYLIVIALLFATPLGLGTAIYLTEYTREGPGHPDHPLRHGMPGRDTLDHPGSLRVCHLRHGLRLGLEPAFGRSDPFGYVAADHHPDLGGIHPGRPPGIPGSQFFPGAGQVADHYPHCPAQRPARESPPGSC